MAKCDKVVWYGLKMFTDKYISYYYLGKHNFTALDFGFF